MDFFCKLDLKVSFFRNLSPMISIYILLIQLFLLYMSIFLTHIIKFLTISYWPSYKKPWSINHELLIRIFRIRRSGSIFLGPPMLYLKIEYAFFLFLFKKNLYRSTDIFEKIIIYNIFIQFDFLSGSGLYKGLNPDPSLKMRLVNENIYCLFFLKRSDLDPVNINPKPCNYGCTFEMLNIFLFIAALDLRIS